MHIVDTLATWATSWVIAYYVVIPLLSKFKDWMDRRPEDKK